MRRKAGHSTSGLNMRAWSKASSLSCCHSTHLTPRLRRMYCGDGNARPDDHRRCAADQRDAADSRCADSEQRSCCDSVVEFESFRLHCVQASPERPIPHVYPNIAFRSLLMKECMLAYDSKS